MSNMATKLSIKCPGSASDKAAKEIVNAIVADLTERGVISEWTLLDDTALRDIKLAWRRIAFEIIDKLD